MVRGSDGVEAGLFRCDRLREQVVRLVTPVREGDAAGTSSGWCLRAQSTQRMDSTMPLMAPNSTLTNPSSFFWNFSYASGASASGKWWLANPPV